MSDEVLERMIESYMATTQPTHSFGWQGGEPTLMGNDFFEKIVSFQKKHGKRGAVVGNGLQTNATLINDELAKHLGRYNFLVGASLDGPEEIHDSYRKTVDGRGSHSEVLRGIESLKKHGVEYNILVLVSSANVENPAEVYRYLLQLGETYHQYIPCVEFNGAGEPLTHTVSARQWGNFLCGIFDEWRKKDTYKVSIRLFDSILTYMVDGVVNVCSMDTNCCQYFVVEYNGDVYPCDFFVQRGLKLGNVMEESWQDLINSPVYEKFGAKKTAWNSNCIGCAYVKFCAGDCQKQRYYGKEDSRQLSFLCEGWKQFYEKALPHFEKLALEIKSRRPKTKPTDQTTLPVPEKLPGRNDPCYCGSGQKYKRCHGR